MAADRATPPGSSPGMTSRQARFTAQWSLSFDAVVDSQNCPRPGTNAATPASASSMQSLIREALRIERPGQEANMLIWPTFERPVLVAIERGPHAGPWDECSS